MYLTELPVIVLLWIAISYNDLSTDLFKYYPLIIFLSLAAVFIAVYFFRVVSISYDEIRYHGLFSSKDSSFIAENKTLTISVRKNHKLGLELYEDGSNIPAFDWMKPEDAEYRDICMFRAKVFAGRTAALRILKFFSLPKEECDGALADGYAFENDDVSIKTEVKNEITQIKIFFKTTKG